MSSQEKTQKQKELMLEQLKKTPIILVACEKLNIARSTFYRWRKQDNKFSEKVDDSILTGNQLVNDMAESQLISGIKDKNMTAIIFWLKHHHRAYETRINVSGHLKMSSKLTTEQEDEIMKALELANLNKLDDAHKSDDNLPSEAITI